MKVIEKVKDDVYLIEHSYFGTKIREKASLSGVKTALQGKMKQPIKDFYIKVEQTIENFEKSKEKKDADKTDKSKGKT